MRSDLARAVLDNRALASHLLRWASQGTLQALSLTCRRWSSDTFLLAPGASRTLALVTRWPAVLREVGGVEGERCHEEELRSRRAQLLESIRMGLQDPQLEAGFPGGAADGSAPAPAGAEGGSAGCAVTSSSLCIELDWFSHRVLRDRGLSDAELRDALRQAAPGDISQLLVCSSRLADNAALSSALQAHAEGLTDLCISNCGSGRLSGAALSGLLRCARPALQSLTLVDVPDVPLAALARQCNLRSLRLRGTLTAPCIEALSSCPSLEVLRLPLRVKVVEAPFICLFTRCRSLRVVDIYGAVDVSDQILACIMLHNKCLEEFDASHDGGGGFSQCLSAPMVYAFRTHFSQMRRVRINNLVKDSVL